jgi:hypothetical protein
VLALHRQLYDDLTAWLRSDPLPAFDPFDYFALAKASEQRREFFGLTYKSTRALPGTAASMRNSTRALPGIAAEPGISRNRIVADFVASDATDLIFLCGGPCAAGHSSSPSFRNALGYRFQPLRFQPLHLSDEERRRIEGTI